MRYPAYTAATVHRLARRNTLLRRGLWPGSRGWQREPGFVGLRDGSEVSETDVKRILARPDLYPVVGDLRTMQGLAAVRFRGPTRELGAGLVHHVNKINVAYGTLISGTGGIDSLATSSTWLAGYEWFLVDNTAAADAGLQLDWFHAGDVQVCTTTTVTASTEIRLYLVGSPDATYWPDVFDGTPSAETVTAAGVFGGFGKLACVAQVDSATQSRVYPYSFAARGTFGGVIPKQYVVFVAHNTGQVLGATAGNQKYFASPEYASFT